MPARGSSTSYYYNYTCMRFLDPVNLFANSDGTTLTSYTVGSGGLNSTVGTSYTLNRFNCFKIVNGETFASLGGVASLSSSGVASQIGTSRCQPATHIPPAPAPSLRICRLARYSSRATPP